MIKDTGNRLQCRQRDWNWCRSALHVPLSLLSSYSAASIRASIDILALYYLQIPTTIFATYNGRNNKLAPPKSIRDPHALNTKQTQHAQNTGDPLLLVNLAEIEAAQLNKDYSEKMFSEHI